MQNSESHRARRQGVVGVCRFEERFLVIRRAAGVEAPGAFCFPGGGVEGEECEEQTLQREFVEELDCRITPVRQLWRSSTDWGVDLSWWLVDGAQRVELRANPDEVASVHWLTLGELRGLAELLSSNHAFLDAWERGEFSLEFEP